MSSAKAPGSAKQLWSPVFTMQCVDHRHGSSKQICSSNSSSSRKHATLGIYNVHPRAQLPKASTPPLDQELHNAKASRKAGIGPRISSSSELYTVLPFIPVTKDNNTMKIQIIIYIFIVLDTKLPHQSRLIHCKTTE